MTAYLHQELEVHIVALGSGPGRLLVAASRDQVDTHGCFSTMKTSPREERERHSCMHAANTASSQNGLAKPHKPRLLFSAL